MASIPKKTAAAKDLDDLTQEEIDQRLTETLQHVDAIKALWSNLVGLPGSARRTSSGRNVALLAPALSALFGVLLTRDGSETPLAGPFHVLGDSDDGIDPERFEVALLARRLHRIEAEHKVQHELEKLVRSMGDDILSTGERVVKPGKLALDLARSMAQGNSAYRSAFTPVLDALSSMTRRARQQKNAKSREDSGEKTKAPAPTAA